VRAWPGSKSQSEHNGGEATLRVSGGAINSQMTGTLPVEITVALDAIATYEVTVEQSDENSFRGAYIKSVDVRQQSRLFPVRIDSANTVPTPSGLARDYQR
jgi:hypothetical protein